MLTPVVAAEICRKLDGIPLAIELAAGRVSAHGLQEIAKILDTRLTMVWRGRRTAPERHQTLNAALDWSYGLLTDAERIILLQLSAFVGAFTIDAAYSMINGPDKIIMITHLESLVEKSLLTTDFSHQSPHYRMLEITRAYVRTKLTTYGESHHAGIKHALLWGGPVAIKAVRRQHLWRRFEVVN